MLRLVAWAPDVGLAPQLARADGLGDDHYLAPFMFARTGLIVSVQADASTYNDFQVDGRAVSCPLSRADRALYNDAQLRVEDALTFEVALMLADGTMMHPRTAAERGFLPQHRAHELDCYWQRDPYPVGCHVPKAVVEALLSDAHEL